MQLADLSAGIPGGGCQYLAAGSFKDNFFSMEAAAEGENSFCCPLFLIFTIK
ncbi:MAG: hypothetical protein PHE24_01415 [Patescibacteria group bacterium]|nr:hypothetical protein [Patescibacteria group bacterium]